MQIILTKRERIMGGNCDMYEYEFIVSLYAKKNSNHVSPESPSPSPSVENSTPLERTTRHAVANHLQAPREHLLVELNEA